MKTVIFSLVMLLFAAKESDTEKYIRLHKSLAQEVDSIFNVPASVCLAQAIIESGSGTSFLCRNNKNHFGIRNGATWMKYESAKASYYDYGAFFKRTSDVCEWPYGGTPERWCQVLQICRYAGDEPGYADALLETIKKYKLTKYDRQWESSK